MATKGEMPPEFNDSDEEEETAEPEIDQQEDDEAEIIASKRETSNVLFG